MIVTCSSRRSLLRSVRSPRRAYRRGWGRIRSWTVCRSRWSASFLALLPITERSLSLSWTTISCFPHASLDGQEQRVALLVTPVHQNVELGPVGDHVRLQLLGQVA